MADLTPNKRPDGQSPEDGGLEKSLESLSLDELLASVKDDLARVDAMMNDKDEEEQAKTQAEAELEQETQPQKQTPNMPPLFEPKIPEEYADLTVDQQPQEPEPAEEKKHGRLPSGIRVLLYVCCVLAASVLLAVFAWRCADDVLSLTQAGRRGDRHHCRRRDDLADRKGTAGQWPCPFGNAFQAVLLGHPRRAHH